jgi:hypothetical protein
MKHIPFLKIFLLPISALFAFALPAHADNAIQVHWSEVCRVAGGNELSIKTVDGKSVDGYCLDVDVDEMQVSNKAGAVVKIARAAFSKIEMRRPSQEQQFTTLRKMVGDALKLEAKWILSPEAPLGIAALPVTVAWGIVATPFCLIQDLAHNESNHKQQIRII